MSWVRPLPHIAIEESEIVSQDLSPLDDLPAIRTRFVQPKKTYNRNDTDTVNAADL